MILIIQKVVESIINRWILASKMTFHDSFHGFVAKGGTCMACVEPKYCSRCRGWYRSPCIIPFQIYARPMILSIGNNCWQFWTDTGYALICQDCSLSTEKTNDMQLRAETTMGTPLCQNVESLKAVSYLLSHSKVLWTQWSQNGMQMLWRT